MNRTPPHLNSYQRDLALLGICPFCEASIRNWGSGLEKNPENRYTLEYVNLIDMRTGHKKSCLYQQIRL